MLQQLADPDAICWSFFNFCCYSMIPFMFFIHQFFHVLLPWIFNSFLIYNRFTWYVFQTVWPCYILSFFYYLLCLSLFSCFRTRLADTLQNLRCSGIIISTEPTLRLNSAAISKRQWMIEQWTSIVCKGIFPQCLYFWLLQIHVIILWVIHCDDL